MIDKEAQLAGLQVLQDLVSGKKPEDYAVLAEIALGIVEDLLRNDTPHPDLALQSMRNTVREEWSRRIREKFGE